VACKRCLTNKPTSLKEKGACHRNSLTHAQQPTKKGPTCLEVNTRPTLHLPTATGAHSWPPWHSARGTTLMAQQAILLTTLAVLHPILFSLQDRCKPQPEAVQHSTRETCRYFPCADVFKWWAPARRQLACAATDPAIRLASLERSPQHQRKLGWTKWHATSGGRKGGRRGGPGGEGHMPDTLNLAAAAVRHFNITSSSRCAV
jgi:hypothetical protein